MADIKELMQVRRDKMQKLIDNGVNVHPERYERTHQIKEARELPELLRFKRFRGTSSISD